MYIWKGRCNMLFPHKRTERVDRGGTNDAVPTGHRFAITANMQRPLAALFSGGACIASIAKVRAARVAHSALSRNRTSPRETAYTHPRIARLGSPSAVRPPLQWSRARASGPSHPRAETSSGRTRAPSTLRFFPPLPRRRCPTLGPRSLC